MRKLDLVIVGAQKAGTTSLNEYLGSHPDVIGHFITEFTYFTDRKVYDTGFESAFRKCYKEKEYKRIVAKNVSINHNEDSLIRLSKHNPDIKIVFILREPVSRAYSSYNMAIKNGWIDNNFDELRRIVINKDFNHFKYRHFIKAGEYVSSLNLILKYFTQENIRMYIFEDLIKFPQLISNDVFKWLGLSKYAISAEVHNRTLKPRSKNLSKIINFLRNQNSYMNQAFRAIMPYKYYSKIGQKIINLNSSKTGYEPMQNEVKEVLKDHYKGTNQKLISMINKEELRGSLILFSADNWISEFYR